MSEREEGVSRRLLVCADQEREAGGEHPAEAVASIGSAVLAVHPVVALAAASLCPVSVSRLGPSPVQEPAIICFAGMT